MPPTCIHPASKSAPIDIPPRKKVEWPRGVDNLYLATTEEAKQRIEKILYATRPLPEKPDTDHYDKGWPGKERVLGDMDGIHAVAKGERVGVKETVIEKRRPGQKVVFEEFVLVKDKKAEKAATTTPKWAAVGLK